MVDDMEGQMACTMKAEDMAWLWLDEWEARVNEEQPPLNESYPDLEMKPLRFGPRHAILTALPTPRDLLPGQTLGKALLYTQSELAWWR